MEQLSLSLDTIQPDEAYLVYRIIREEYDEWRDEYTSSYDNDMGWGPPQIKYRASYHDEKLEGVVTDDNSYHAMQSRFEPFAKRLSDQLIADNTESKKYENYTARVEYEFRKIKHIVMKEV